MGGSLTSHLSAMVSCVRSTVVPQACTHLPSLLWLVTVSLSDSSLAVTESPVCFPSSVIRTLKCFNVASVSLAGDELGRRYEGSGHCAHRTNQPHTRVLGIPLP
ncbi:hypothetical protein AMECASPLE_032235 [Ameca splendens]|uniref:Secreted protein n=1 Tax=Ameca splendens TaxID=208324 RepID=A0ABV0ZGM7_9TELE